VVLLLLSVWNRKCAVTVHFLRYCDRIVICKL
jgi:hypothetical protein